MSPDDLQHAIRDQFRAYRATLQDDRRHLLERFEVIDVARKVVGVGSVGTRAFIVLLQGRDQEDPLFLQVKEATRSVLEDHLPKSRYRQSGERVVQGQRMMQAASDIYLGWTKGVQENRYLYWRQLRDMKGSAVVETIKPFGLRFYARMCGWTLARAHARSGDPIAIAAYLGKRDEFDHSISDFSAAVRRPEREGLPGLRRCHPLRAAPSHRRRLTRRPDPIPGDHLRLPRALLRGARREQRERRHSLQRPHLRPGLVARHRGGLRPGHRRRGSRVGFAAAIAGP